MGQNFLDIQYFLIKIIVIIIINTFKFAPGFLVGIEVIISVCPNGIDYYYKASRYIKMVKSSWTCIPSKTSMTKNKNST